jgi:threonine dehydratase
VTVTPTIADGQQTSAIGRNNCAVIAGRVDEVVGVTDDEIVTTMRFLFERMKVVVEPSGASALAALMAGRIDASGQRVGVTLSGGNIDAASFAALMAG